MNRFTRLKEHKEPPDTRRQARTSGGGRLWVWSLTAKIIIIALLIFGAHSIQVFYKARTVELNNEKRRIDAEIKIIKQENMILRTKKANLSARPYIQKKTEKLGLRAADYRQVCHVALLQEPRQASGGVRSDYAAASGEKEKRNTYSATGRDGEKKNGKKDGTKVASVF